MSCSPESFCGPLKFSTFVNKNFCIPKMVEASTAWDNGRILGTEIIYLPIFKSDSLDQVKAKCVRGWGLCHETFLYFSASFLTTIKD
uniref:Uncharacterized protein n=1 Tax=Romanomermis culicivorax TaxID=13658 RepID=A0A915L8B8_ROMCU